MTRSDFTYDACGAGYFLYYKGRMIGGDGNDSSHIRDRACARAEAEIDRILAGHGRQPFLIVIQYIDSGVMPLEKDIVCEQMKLL
jgi:hypothetical protein